MGLKSHSMVRSLPSLQLNSTTFDFKVETVKTSWAAQWQPLIQLGKFMKQSVTCCTQPWLTQMDPSDIQIHQSWHVYCDQISFWPMAHSSLLKCDFLAQVQENKSLTESNIMWHLDGLQNKVTHLSQELSLPFSTL